MQAFKDLEFHGPPEALRKFPMTLEKVLPDGWTRSLELEARLNQAEDDPMFLFACSEALSRRAAGLCLAFRGVDVLYVSNIVPQKAGSLSLDEYNHILDEFASLASSVAAESGIKAVVSGGFWRIEEHLSSSALKKLRHFSATTNRATGTAHPDDEARWFDFIVSSHVDRCDLDASDFERWLIEEEGWPEVEASALVIQYENARSLLRYYDERG